MRQKKRRGFTRRSLSSVLFQPNRFLQKLLKRAKETHYGPIKPGGRVIYEEFANWPKT